MVNEFNSYFSSVFTSDDLSNVPNTNNLFLPDVRCRDLIFAEEDVKKKLSALREDKAAGPDNLSPRVYFRLKTRSAIHYSCCSVKVWMKAQFLRIGRSRMLIQFLRREVEVKPRIIDQSA